MDRPGHDGFSGAAHSPPLPSLQQEEILNSHQDTQINDGTEEAPLPPKPAAAAAAEADTPHYANKAAVPEAAPIPPPATAAPPKSECVKVNNPRPVPLLTPAWPKHFLPEDLHHSPSVAGDQGHAQTGTFPVDGDGGEASTQAGHIHQQAVVFKHGSPHLELETIPIQEHTPQPLELCQGSGTPELVWIWETEG